MKKRIIPIVIVLAAAGAAAMYAFRGTGGKPDNRLMVSGNTVVDPRNGFLVTDSGPIQLDSNRITGATVFGVSARGASAKVTGVGNVISGSGFRAVDARADASMPALTGTNISGWAYHGTTTFWSYLRFHPLAAMWLSIVILVLLAWVWSHRRRMSSHPYPASTRWRADPPGIMAGAKGAPTPVLVFAGSSGPVHRTVPFPVISDPGLAAGALIGRHRAPGVGVSGNGFGSWDNGHRSPGNGQGQPGNES